jgi:hypothetical protein
MKIRFDLLFILLTGILYAHPVHGQIQMEGLDSIPMLKPKGSKSLYRFTDNGAKEIQILDNKIELTRHKPNAFLRDAGNGALTALTGFGFGSTTDGTWKISGTIHCNDTLNDWLINMFCEGYLQKDRERVRNDDGSRSVETTETYVYYWEKNASGLIMESKDTIGYFLIVMNPREDSLLKSWSDVILPKIVDKENAKPKIKFTVSWKPLPGNDYGIIGKLRNRDFFIIRNGTDRKAWISMDNIMRCKFQSDPDYPGLSKKYNIMPYLLINKNVPGQDRRDLFRLSMLNRFMNSYLDQNRVIQ